MNRNEENRKINDDAMSINLLKNRVSAKLSLSTIVISIPIYRIGVNLILSIILSLRDFHSVVVLLLE